MTPRKRDIFSARVASKITARRSSTYETHMCFSAAAEETNNYTPKMTRSLAHVNYVCGTLRPLSPDTEKSKVEVAEFLHFP